MVLVAVPAVTTFLILAALPQPSFSLICERGKQFLDHELQMCVNCKQCGKDLVVIRPCAVHQDTKCGTINNLLMILNSSENRHRHPKHHLNHRRGQHIAHGAGGLNPVDSTQRAPGGNDELSDIVAVTSTEVPFSSMEALVWDWQAVALTFAVFSCILFFLVIALYSLHQAKQWRRLKENFEADVEQLSATLSLMAASSSEKGEVLEPTSGPIHDSNYLNNRCMYLEQLLHVRKDKKPGTDTGNVYIEDANACGKT